MSPPSPSVTDRLAKFVSRELGPAPGRARAFGRTLVGLLLTIGVLQVFRAPNPYWALAFVILVSSPAVGKSERDALKRAVSSTVGGALAVVFVLAAYDLPWVYVPLQAIVIGAALFLARTTPLGAVILSGATTFAVISGGTREVGATGLVHFAWIRFLLSVLGCGVGALAQLTLWPEDLVAELRRSLTDDLRKAESLLAGRPTSLDAGRVSRHFELLTNAEERNPGLVHCRASISLLILDVARLVDETLSRERLPAEERAHADELLAEVRVQLGRCHEAQTFEPPAAPPAPPGPRRWPNPFADSLRLPRRASLKAALAALLAVVILDTMQLTAAGGLLVCLVLGMGMSTGTRFSKAFIPLVGIFLAMGVLLLASGLGGRNVDDLGSYAILLALAFAPGAWAAVSGPRVRLAALLGTVLLSVGLVGSYSPPGDLEASASFLVALSVACLVVAAVDRAVWPIDRDAVMARRVVEMIRAAARLTTDIDPRLVLAPNREPRWALHRSLRGVVELRGEAGPAPGTTAFARDEQALRIAGETQRLALERVEQARRELQGEASAATAEQRRTWATNLRSRADRIERSGDVFAG